MGTDTVPKGTVVSVALFEKKTGRYDFEKGCREVTLTPNADWIEQVKKAIPDAKEKIIVFCSDGRQRAIMALQELDEMGYENIVGVRGGFNNWFACLTASSYAAQRAKR